MRIKIEINTNRIPLSYRMPIVSMIKNTLEKYSPEYYKKLYFFENKKNKKIKPFTFSVFLEDYQMEKEEINIKEKIYLVISTPDTELFINIYNGLLKMSKYTYNNKFTLSIGKIILLREKPINSEETIFKVLSPIVIKDKSGKFLNVEDEKYVNELNYISDLSLKTYRGFGLTKPLKFEQVDYEKVVVKEKISGFKEVTKKDTFYITGYKGIFKLTGDKEDLRLLYELGIGYRRSQGFGNVEVIG